jgi:hypothetical protein
MVLKISQLMPYGERKAVCSEIHTKHVNKAESYHSSARTAQKTQFSVFTSPDIWWRYMESGVLIVLLPPGGGPLTSKRYIVTRLTEFYIRLIQNEVLGAALTLSSGFLLKHEVITALFTLFFNTN